MELIDLYTNEIGRQLPEKIRADIQKEIRSLIEDNLEDEAEKAGRAPDEEMVVEVLKRMGPPEKVAAAYLPPRYLIGPELYPHFIQTLRIVLSIVTLLTALAIGVSARVLGPFEYVGRVISSLLDTIFHATGIVVAIFAIIQFASLDLKMKTQAWDPLKMKAEPDPERVSIPGALAKIVITVLALVIFNLYPQWVGLSSFSTGEWVHAPVLTAAFFQYLPWLSLLWAAEAGMNMRLVARGKWSQSLRWLSVVIAVLTVVILAWMLAGPEIVTFSAADLARLGGTPPAELVPQLDNGIQTSVRLPIGIMIALQMLELGKQLYKLLRNRLPGALVLD